MLNLYPDSLGGTLDDVVDFLKTEEAEGAFSSCYILPSLYHADLDRGFSVIDYSLNKMYASGETLEAIKKLGIELKLDFILNHASVLSKQFQDIIAKGEESEYKDFFINWNEFWKDCGEMTEQGYILPEEKYLKKLRDNGYLGYSREGDKYWYTQEDVDRFLRRFHYEAFAIGDELPKQQGGGYV